MTPTAFLAPSSAAVVPVLDASQRAVVDLPDGASASVLGAPGSGKTTTLIEFTAERVLARGWSPSELLVLAPTRATATRLRDRLTQRWGLPLDAPAARTPTSFAFAVVRRAAAAAHEPPPALLTGGEQDAMLRELLAGHLADGTGPVWPPPLSPEVLTTRRFRSELRELLLRATEYGVGPDGLRRLASAHGHPEWAAVAGFAEEWTEVVAQASESRLDPAELLAFAAAAIERGEVDEGVSGLRAVVLDDAQEATRSTLQLLGALSARGVPVVAFGDPDAASNAFRGGEPDALAALGARLKIPDLQRLELDRVHRHGPQLRGMVRGVVERIGTAGAGAQRRAEAVVTEPVEAPSGAGSGAEADASIVVIEAASAPRQFGAIARRLRERHLRDGVPWSGMAVILRTNGQLAGAERALALAEVPVRTSIASRSLRDDRAARQLLAIVEVAVGRRELDVLLAVELLQSPFGGLDAVGVRRLRLALRSEELAGGGGRPADALVLEALQQAERLATVDTREGRRARRLARLLAAVRAGSDTGATVDELLWTAWDGSGLAARWRADALGTGIAADEASRSLDGVLAVFAAAKRFVERRPHDPARLFLDALLDADVADDALIPQQSADAVLLATPSAVVGDEFDTVAVAGLQDGVWPNLALRGSLLGTTPLLRAVQGIDPAAIDEPRQVLDDELRLFALAVSRARERLVLAAVANDDESPSRLLALAPADAPRLDGAGIRPLTLRALTGDLRRELTAASGSGPLAEQRRLDAARGLAVLAAERLPGAHPDDWHGLLPLSTQRPLFDLDDPETVVPVSPSKLEAVEQNPLRWFIDRIASSPPTPHLAFGRVVHWALETGGADAESLWAAIEARWDELGFDAPWIAEQQKRQAKRMTIAMAEYLRDAAADGRGLVAAEGTFEVVVGRAVLRGAIDRVEQHGGGAVLIVDLKTGKTVPSASAVKEHAQLSAYQLAYDAGAIEGLREPHSSGGAALLYVRDGVKGKLHRLLPQAPLDAEGLDAFRGRVAEAVQRMAAAGFEAEVEIDEFAPGGARFGWHVVPAVSSD